MGQSGDKPENQQGFVIAGQGTGQVAQRVEGHQKNEQLPPEQLRTENGQNGCADYYAQRIGGDKVAYLWLRNAEILGDIGHQPHDGEFAGTDTRSEERRVGKECRSRWWECRSR